MKKIIMCVFVIMMAVMVGLFSVGCDNLVDDSLYSKPDNKNYYLGERVSYKGITYVVNSIYDTNKIKYNTTDNNYIVVKFTVTNNSEEVFSQNPINVFLILDGAEFSYSSATYSLENACDSFEEVNPGLSKTFNIAFETQKKSTEAIYSIKFVQFSLYGENSVTINLCEKPN